MGKFATTLSIPLDLLSYFRYDAAVHLSEETKGASMVVARGMYIGTVASWLLSVPTVIIMLLCIQDFNGIASGTYTNNFAVYLLQIVGKKGTVTILVLCWLDAMLNTAVCFMSAQRVTYAIARDGILPGSNWIRKLSKNHMPVNAAWVVLFCAVAIEAAIIGSTVAFYALTATATISTNLSYLVPIVARHTIGRKHFTPAKWNLGKFSPIVGTITALYILFQFVVLMLPQVFPVNAVRFPLDSPVLSRPY
jgi:amino acid transporter